MAERSTRLQKTKGPGEAEMGETAFLATDKTGKAIF